MSIIVQKYGGSSLATTQRIKEVASHIASCYRNGQQLIVVVSAMGKHTDQLIQLAKEIHPNPDRRELDMLLTVGERTSMALLSMALHHFDIPSQSLTGSQCGILTDTVHGNATIKKILGDRIRQILTENKIAIVAGFQGMSVDKKEITTLGRGGSDVSAIALAAALQADLCELYKDVDGVLNFDPKLSLTQSPKKLDHISTTILSKAAWCGAKVIHPRAVHLALKFNVQLEIRSSFNLETRGTIVSSENMENKKMESPVMSTLAKKEDMSIVQIKWNKNNSNASIQKNISAWLWEHGHAPNINQILIEQEKNCWQMDIPTLLNEELTAYIQTQFKNDQIETAEIAKHMVMASIIGCGFRQSLDTQNSIYELNKKLNFQWLEIQDTAITIGIDKENEKMLMDNLIHLFI